MVKAPSTLDVGTTSDLVSGQRDEETPALLIAWAATEPERVGEVALLEPGAGALILGRGEAAGSGRVIFYRQRPGVLEAELFGNVKGYPNPGMPERPGLIGAADGGTLFLDEIGELPQSLQASLLRVLDEGGEYMNLGGSNAKRSRFRLLAATNRDPTALKHDLSARLVLRLSVPGLDERLDDIPLLVRHLLRRAAAKSPEATRRFMVSGGPDLRVKASLVDQLLQAKYTTNIRELDALLWRAMSASTRDAIEWSSDFPASGSISPPCSNDDAPEEQETKTEHVTEPSEAEVRARLAEHGGNIVRTAHALGLSSRYVLYRLMRKYGIEG